ncbi:MAG TPA: enoyl-CoA hydratase/isomerase family protein [Streptosporangiaceae bacterium]
MAQTLCSEHTPAGYRRLLLARPERHNAIDLELARALCGALREEEATPVVLASADPRMFCAGADLNIDDADRATVSDLLYECYEIMITRPGPVIAVVSGPAVGGGAQLAAAADLRIAGPAARLRWTGPPGRGLAVGAWVLTDLVGRGAAMELALTGRWVTAAEALAMGLVNRVEDDPRQAAEGLAGDLAAHDLASLASVKKVAAAGGLLDRLHAERQANASAWTGVTAPAAG